MSSPIFVIGEFVNTPQKEKTLINLIERLKSFNIPILLTGHYPVSQEIQRMVDYYLFDKNNPILSKYDFHKHNLVSKTLWVETNKWRAEYAIDSTDFAIWNTMRYTFNFCEILGKNIVHFMEYDNLPSTEQYLTEFILPMGSHEASVFEVYELGKKIHRYKTFMFSIRTDLARKIFNLIKTEKDYYGIHDDKFLLEDVFYKYLNLFSDKIYLSKYASNKSELDIHGQFEDNLLTHFFLCSQNNELYVLFLTKVNINEFLVEIEYDGQSNVYHINNGYLIVDHMEFLQRIGKYEVGKTIKIRYNGSEISDYTLNMDWETFRIYNKIDIYGA